MKRIFLILFCAALGTTFAQNAGSAGLSFLKLGFGARNAALADNGTVFSKDAGAVFYNPANLVFASSDQVQLTHNQWIQDVSSEIVAARLTFWGIPFGIGVNSTAVKDIEIRSRPGPKEGTFDAHYFAGSLSAGYLFMENIAAGATFKYLYEGLYTDESNGYAFDFGVSWHGVYDKFEAALAVKNLGKMDTLHNDVTKLPSELRLGVYYPAGRVIDKISLNGGVEYQKYFDLDNSHINLGAEAVYDDMFALRVGYMSGYEGKSFTSGIGVRYKNIDFDYAFVPFKDGLGTANTFSLKVEF